MNQEDLPAIAIHDNIYATSKAFTTHWQAEKLKEKPQIVRAIFHTFASEVGVSGIVLLISSATKIYQALMLGKLVQFIFDENVDWSDKGFYSNGYVLSAQIVFCGVLATFEHHYFFFMAWRLGMQIKMLMICTIYEKSIQLDLREFAHMASGKVVNMASHECEIFQAAGTFVHYTYAAIIESLAILVIGILYLGPSFLAGYGLIILLVPLQGYFSRKIAAARRETNTHTDMRLKLVSQALVGARLMKINGWEWKLSEHIEAARAAEVAGYQRTNRLRAINEAIFFSTPVVVSAATFLTYVYSGGVLIPRKVFAVLVLFSITQMTMTKFFAMSVEFLTQVGDRYRVALETSR